MGVKRRSTIHGGSGARRSLSPKLEVKPDEGRGGWAAFWAGSDEALFFEDEEADAEDKAINHLAARDGGHVVVHRSDALVVITTVARLPSRAQILEQGRKICATRSMPLVVSGTAADFDVPEGDLEFVVALWHVCVAHPLVMSCETDLGIAYQYGPYVLLNRDSERFTLEECESTAAAMRRLSEVTAKHWSPRGWVPPHGGTRRLPPRPPD